MTATVEAKADIRSLVSPEEWQTRVDLAAAYRLVALYGWDDLIFTHLSARVPGADHHFLLNPYGMMFEEVTASSLVRSIWPATKSWTRPTLSILPDSRFTVQYMKRVRTLCA